MTASPISGQHNYVTVEQTAEARDRAVQAVQKRLRGKSPNSRGKMAELVDAVTTYKVDYREIADSAGVSGIAVLQILSASIERDEDVAAAYHAGLLTERHAVEEYREKVIEAQRKEVQRLLAADWNITSIARDLGVTRNAVRAWATTEAAEASDSDAS